MSANEYKPSRFPYDFYRANYHKLLRALIFTTTLILCLIIAIIYFILFQPTQRYYASTLSGQIIPMVPQSK